MTIGFDAKRAFQNFTGLGNYSRFVIEALLQYEPQNQYFAYSPKKNASVHFSENLKIQTPKSKILSSIWRSWLIINDLKKDNINIFHGLSNEIPFQIRQKKIKSVVTIHDLIFERYPELYPAIDRFFYQKKFRYACQNADAIVAISQQTKRDIIDFYQIPAERIVVIYQDCQEIYKNIFPEKDNKILEKYHLSKPYILCVSSFSERKNQKRLVEAFRMLGLKDFELILVGNQSNYSDEILENIHQKGDKNIHILDGVPSADLPTLYQQSSLVVYPSFFEGFGIPIIEALHSGVPVVAASGSCMEEAGGKATLYANPLDTNDLAHKMQEILSNEFLQKKLIEEGKTQVKKFTPQNIAHQLNELYLSL
jgi:glycosyltransferase involved in cell wall biosynthesis